MQAHRSLSVTGRSQPGLPLAGLLLEQPTSAHTAPMHRPAATASLLVLLLLLLAGQPQCQAEEAHDEPAAVDESAQEEADDDDALPAIVIDKAEEERIGLWKRMIEAGADVNKVGSDGTGPLHFAAENGHAGLVEHLLGAGADVHHPDELGHTALHVAARLGHHTVASRLLAAGADVKLKVTGGERKGMRALELAQAEEKHAVAELLAAAEQELR
jgi:ankyrin repeat protein